MDIERWKIWISIVDVVTKSAIAGAIGIATYTFNVDSSKSSQETERFNQETSCWDVIHKTVAFAYSNHSLIGEQINSIKTYLPEACGKNQQLKEFGGVLLSFLQTRKSDAAPAALARADPLAGVGPHIMSVYPSTSALLGLSGSSLAGQAATTFGSAGAPAADRSPPAPAFPSATPNLSSASAGPLEPGAGSGSSGEVRGWVAVGYKDTPDFNFTLPDGSPIIADLTRGSMIEAKWSVYVRPRPAGWDKTVATLRAGQCFKLANAPRSLSAGTRVQIWAEGTVEICN